MTSVSEHNSEQEGEGGDGVNGGVHLSIQIQIILQKNVFVGFQDEIHICNGHTKNVWEKKVLRQLSSTQDFNYLS